MTLGHDGQPWSVRLGSGPGYQLVWLAVLERAILDAARAPVLGTILPRQEARRWLTGRSADLLWVLTACNIDPGFWFERVVPELRAQWHVIDAARDTGVRRRRGAPPTAWADEAARLSA